MNFYAYAMSEKVIEAMSSNSRFFQPAYNENTSHFRRHIFKRRKPRYHQMLSTICGVASPKQIDYVGINNYSQFSYDGLWRNTKIVETTSGSVTSTKQFVWSPDAERAEERDVSASVMNLFFTQGVIAGGTSLFYAKNLLTSITELTTSTGSIQAQYSYDPYGRASTIQAISNSDFLYAGYYQHTRSGQSQTMYRNYRADLGRWISRDPIEEQSGANLFSYVLNCPSCFFDPTGLAPETQEEKYKRCLREYYNCLQLCLAAQKAELSGDLELAAQIMGAAYSSPIPKAFIGVPTVMGAGSKWTTAGGYLGWEMFSGMKTGGMAVPTAFERGAGTRSLGTVAARIAMPLGLAFFITPSMLSWMHYKDCSDNCAKKFRCCMDAK